MTTCRKYRKKYSFLQRCSGARNSKLLLKVILFFAVDIVDMVSMKPLWAFTQICCKDECVNSYALLRPLRRLMRQVRWQPESAILSWPCRLAYPASHGRHHERSLEQYKPMSVAQKCILKRTARTLAHVQFVTVSAVSIITVS